jgi:predicted nuclease of predicted toxin-antitoxin system
MKLLFDRNLSFKLPRLVPDLLPRSTQVGSIGLDTAEDSEIWEYAREHGYVMVTQDGDFSNLSALRGYPPKVVWLRCGNCPTRKVEQLLRRHHARIGRFLDDPLVGFLEIS